VRPLIVWHIFRKDLVETLRDRRALFTTLVLPLVLYPLLFTAIGSFTSNKREQIKSQPARIAVWGPVPETAVEAVLKENATLVDRRASVPPSPEDMARQLVTDKTRPTRGEPRRLHPPLHGAGAAGLGGLLFGH